MLESSRLWSETFRSRILAFPRPKQKHQCHLLPNQNAPLNARQRLGRFLELAAKRVGRKTGSLWAALQPKKLLLSAKLGMSGPLVAKIIGLLLLSSCAT